MPAFTDSPPAAPSGARGDAIDRGDDRLPCRLDALPVAGDEFRTENIHIAPIGHGCDVSTCGKRFVTARDDDDANAIVGIQRQQRIAQSIHQRIIQGVELLRSVQGEHPNPTLAL